VNADQRLLSAWDQGQESASFAGRVRALLALTDAEDGFATLPVGAANLRLLNVQRELFGAQLFAVVDCPVCTGRMELAFSVSSVTEVMPSELPEIMSVETTGERARFRLPTWADLIAALNESGGHASDRLLHCCLLEIERENGHPAGATGAGLSDALVGAVAAAMEEADPLAEIRLRVVCPDCNDAFEARLDPPDFLWAEVDAGARGLLDDVHTLANAYGWREVDILALSPTRRRAYLDIVAGR
jgi:hypothetical protein